MKKKTPIHAITFQPVQSQEIKKENIPVYNMIESLFIMKFFYGLMNGMYYLFHPPIKIDQLNSLIFTLNGIHKLQVLELLDLDSLQINGELRQNSQISEKSTIVKFLRSVSVFNLLSYDQKVDLIYLITVVNVLFYAFVIVVSFKYSNSKDVTIKTSILNIFYYLLLMLPFLKLTSDVALNGQSIEIKILAGINFVLSLSVNLTHLYFGRADKIMDDCMVAPIRYSFIMEISIRLFKWIALILSDLNTGKLPIFIFILCFYYLNYHECIKAVRMDNIIPSAVSLFSITLLICLYFDFKIHEFMLITILCQYLNIQLNLHIVAYKITKNNQFKIAYIQIVEYAYLHKTETQNQLILSILHFNHKSLCKKCISQSRMTECLLKKNYLQVKSEKNILLYCHYIAEVKPIESVLILLKCLKADSIYSKSAQNFLSKQLNRSIQETHSRFRPKQSDFMDVNSVRQAIDEIPIMMEVFLESVRSQIMFWKQLVKGLGNLENYLKQIDETSNILIKSNKIINEVFDVDNGINKKSFEQEIISMRLIQIFYSSICQNPSIVSKKEKQINELVRNDRFKQQSNLDNITLIDDRVLVLKTSLINNPGFIINPNQEAIYKFLDINYKNQLDITRIEQLMPSFIANVHSELVKNYVRRGFTHLGHNFANIYMQRPDGYLSKVKIFVYHSIENLDDYIVDAIITKSKVPEQIILFAPDGKLLGLDQQAYQQICQKKDFISYPLSDMLQKCVIQFLVKNIDLKVQQLKERIEQEQIYKITSQQDQLIQLDRFNINLEHINKTFQQFSTFQHSFHSNKTHSQKKFKQTINFMVSMKNETLNQINQMTIDDKNIPMLNQNLNDHFKHMIESQNYNFQNIIYDLELKIHSFKRKTIYYFILIITDNNIENKSLDEENFDRISQLSKQSRKFNMTDKESEDDQEPGYILSPQYNQQEKYRFIDYITSRPNLTNVQLLKSEGIDSIDNTQQLSNRQNQIINKEILQQNTQRLSSRTKRSEKPKKLKINEIDIDRQSVSQSLGDNSNKDFSFLLRQLFIDQTLSKPTKRVLLFNISLIISLFVVFLINFTTINFYFQSQNDKLIQLEIPQTINFYFTSLFTQRYFKMAQNKGIYKFSQYIQVTNDQTLINALQQANQKLISYSLQLNYFDTFNFLRIYQNQQLSQQNSLQTSYQILLEEFNHGIDQTIQPQGTVRQNIIQLIDIHDKIIADNAQLIQNTQTNGIIYFIIVEIIFITLIYTIQYKWWIQLDDIEKRILFALTTITESRVDWQIQRLSFIEGIIKNHLYSEWRLQNFGDIMFERISTKFAEREQKLSNQSILSTKIQGDYYINKSNLLINGILFLLSILFIITGYFIFTDRSRIYTPSINTITEFIRFKHNYDSAVLAGTIIKLEPILFKDLSFVDQNQTISYFYYYQNKMSELMTDFIKQSNDSNNVFKNDLCQQAGHIINMCNKVILEHYPNDNYSNLLINGLVGLQQQFNEFANIEYQSELSTRQYSINSIENLQIVQSQLFQNLFLQYFTDFQQLMDMILHQYVSDSSNLTTKLIQEFRLFYFLGGIIFLSFLSLTFILLLKIKILRQKRMTTILSIVPQFQIASQNFRAQIKQISKLLH